MSDREMFEAFIKTGNRLLCAALDYVADQSEAKDKRVGLVQPVTVAQAIELNAACDEMADVLTNLKERPHV